MNANHKPAIETIGKKNLFQSFLIQISNCCKTEKNLIVGVYDIHTNKILYCSNALENVLGYFPASIIGNGWELWYKKINPAEAQAIKDKIIFLKKEIICGVSPKALSFNYHIRARFGKLVLINHELSLYRIQDHFIALNYLYDISQKEKIERLLGDKKPAVLQNAGNIPISKREKEVLVLISKGFSSKQIADELYISNHTAVAHRKSLIEKFNVKNTAQLIKEASKSILM
ncbi:MAG: response regulator transcription factor [Draconibacterium sp.]